MKNLYRNILCNVWRIDILLDRFVFRYGSTICLFTGVWLGLHWFGAWFMVPNLLCALHIKLRRD